MDRRRDPTTMGKTNKDLVPTSRLPRAIPSPNRSPNRSPSQIPNPSRNPSNRPRDRTSYCRASRSRSNHILGY